MIFDLFKNKNSFNPQTCFALMDGNNFFVSCERVFNPKLQNRPVIVLSNNDGCAIARSNEAKDLGIPMGAPLHTFSHMIKKHEIALLSSNFELYGDMSHRMMNILRQFSPDIEIYSIDEAFIDLSNVYYRNEGNLQFWAQSVYDTILQNVGIPTTIGIAPTKTLSKIANRWAKKSHQPFHILGTQEQIQHALQSTRVEDIWGIGRKLHIQLKCDGIYTAYDLACKDPRWARKKMTVVGERLVRELQGTPCLTLETLEKNKQSIQVSRSFGTPLTQMEDIAQALSQHASRLGEKLRSQNLATPFITVYCRTNPFSKNPFHKCTYTVGLPQPTNDTETLIKASLYGLKQMFKEGYTYHKAGIHAFDLISTHQIKQNTLSCLQQPHHLFQSSQKSQTLSHTIDHINIRFGQDTLLWSSSGIQPKHLMKQNNRTPRYTTRWEELVTVRA